MDILDIAISSITFLSVKEKILLKKILLNKLGADDIFADVNSVLRESYESVIKVRSEGEQLS